MIKSISQYETDVLKASLNPIFVFDADFCSAGISSPIEHAKMFIAALKGLMFDLNPQMTGFFLTFERRIARWLLQLNHIDLPLRPISDLPHSFASQLTTVPIQILPDDFQVQNYSAPIFLLYFREVPSVLGKVTNLTFSGVSV